jgi:hypothetical protein
MSSVRPTPVPRAATLAVAGVAALALAGPGLAGCATTAPPHGDPVPGTTSLPPQVARDQLAGRAAAAKDHRYVATYRLTTPRRADRTVTVAFARDGAWAVSIPGGALGGYADIAMLGSPAGRFECVLGPAAGAAAAGVPPVAPACIKLHGLTAATDPRIQHVFTDWIDPLTDRETAISVATATRLPGAGGVCYSIESNSTQLSPPVDPGIYCYDTDGTLTGARLGFGTLLLIGTPGPAPTTITMPAPVTAGPALPQQAPPAPSKTPGSVPPR